MTFLRCFCMQVFGLYFMQTYIGLFYHAILHRNFLTLRKILTQRMIASQLTSRVEKEHLKPSYSASIGEDLEDGLFDGKPHNCQP
ncbi:hypothetical protein Sjap_008364 [Stephania japonica]|uniref:Uncharacterized protein n=1 Tax=Stephania japonica TaxID=461633 RepID=A0AAP0PEJ0_9MAGN